MRTRYGWILPAWSSELRKLLSYRVDFWLDFAGSLIVQVGLAWFLWDAILRARGTETVGGMGLQALVLYYLLVPLVEKISRGPEMGFLSNEIYDGTLTRYLVYPVPLFGYKYVLHLAVSTIALVQLFLALGVYVSWRGVPEPFEITWVGLLFGVIAAIAASALYFHMAACLELVAYWADNVWSLLVMLRFAIRLLGGGMIPLSLFPELGQQILEVLPFAPLLSFPIRTILGEIGPGAYVKAMALLVGWTVAFAALARWIHARGSRRYTGVGI
ncbi:MAG TPA: ABC-2 family transporter protein [Candidatus Krumholzibacteria bacterium]|nr:ABC-2 family transporter protein [Candidatus Krumholzibacteria bacterium]